MAEDPETQSKKTSTQTLAELVARRKAALGDGSPGGAGGGRRQTERAAAARSASKSKPALRK